MGRRAVKGEGIGVGKVVSGVVWARDRMSRDGLETEMRDGGDDLNPHNRERPHKPS